MAGAKHPKWLPADWKVVQIKRSGRKKTGYIAPKTGLKFFTKQKVLRYLYDVHTHQQQREVEQHKVTIERMVAENLPAGWIKEVQTRGETGKKHNSYIQPATRRKFRSLISALRHLKSKQEEKDHIGAEDDPSQSVTGVPTEAGREILIDNKGDEAFAEGKTGVSERRPANSGTEDSMQQNELRNISIQDYSIETGVDFRIVPPREDIQMNINGEAPAASSLFEPPPNDFFNELWF